MKLTEIEFLQSPQGKRMLQGASQIKELHQRLKWLRQELSADQAALVSQQVWLRQKAAKKFVQAEKMLFDETGLEQATAQPIASYIGKRYAPCQSVADLTCGMGGDAIGISGNLLPESELIVMDSLASKVRLAEHNLAVYGRKAQTLVADAEKTIPQSASYFLDPDRRACGKRVVSLEESQPGLAAICRLLERCSQVGVKVSPALDYQHLALEAEVEVIAWKGECREIMLWCGDFCTAKRRATLLPQGESFTGEGHSCQEYAPLGSFLYQVHPAILRGHLLAELAHCLELAPVDPTLGYLTGESFCPSPWLSNYRVEASLAFSEKALRKELRQRQAGQLTVKSKGFVHSPNYWEKRLQVAGEQAYTVFLFRVNDKPLAVLTRFMNQTNL